MNQCHPERIVCDLGLENPREVSTLCVQEVAINQDKDDKSEESLNRPEATKCRAIAARISHLAAEPDMQFASKCASKHMANPTHEGLAVLKRIGRFFQAHNRMIQRIEWCNLQSELHGYADSD